MSMASERTTDGEKKRCLESSPSSGSERQAAQEAGVTKATRVQRQHQYKAERKGRMSGGMRRFIYPVLWEMWAVPTLIGA